MGRGTQQNIEVSNKTLRKKIKECQKSCVYGRRWKNCKYYANRSVRNACFMPLSLITEGLLHGASAQVWMLIQILSFQQNPQAYKETRKGGSFKEIDCISGQGC